MKRFPRLEAFLVLTVAISGCADTSADQPGNANIATGPGGEMLLVNPESAGENYAMEAAFEGSLILNEENCIIGKTAEGQEMALVFPSGTRFAASDPLSIEVEGQSIEVGKPMPVTLGGGVISQGQLEKLLEGAPQQCRHEETFYVQTISSPQPENRT
ncbi:hypothetical protein D477_002728 [Arthrobacter crystallopoietes BAB-32]|uniref:Lipoprotein n=1 Tax=Arthrobacter crystallopoietes BAB-32 TaxID=1246476 RepID=N1V6K2_9MICC|nr:hypothetical protein [Arthrobacter crystallopoietes]EMY35727.1 hypothetical protein D477_002728 [Arthrobacter crystallopoietes BAB-32]